MKQFRAVGKKVDPLDPLDFPPNEKSISTGDTQKAQQCKVAWATGSNGSNSGPVFAVTAPVRLGRGQNDRGHRRVLDRKKKAEREQAHQLGFVALSPRLWPRSRIAIVRPWWVRLVRISPGTRELDDDNLRGSLKAVRDGVADRLHVDDGDKRAVRFLYAQERGPWAVRIEFHLTRPEHDDE